MTLFSRRTHVLLTFLVALLLAALTTPAATAAGEVSRLPSQSWSVNGRVMATEIVGDTVYVGGTFTQATSPSGQVAARRNLAAFSMSTGELRTDFKADAGAAVRALSTDGSTLYVGGYFGRVNGVNRPYLASLSLSTGAVDTRFRPEPNGAVLALDVQSGWVYAGGVFTAMGGQAHLRLAKVQTTWGLHDSTFNASADSAVRGIVKSPTTNDLYAAGSFGRLSGVSRVGVGAVSASSGVAVGPSFANTVRPALGLAISADGTQLFGALGARSNSAIAWSTVTGARQWEQRTDGDVQAIAYDQGRVYFGFHDGFAGDDRLRVLRADARSGLIDWRFTPYFDLFWGVFALATSDAGVVVGGEFTIVSGLHAQGFAQFR